MPFNSQTYHANKSRKRAWQELAEAREIRDRAARGEASDFEVSRIATLVKLARLSMRFYLLTRKEAK